MLILFVFLSANTFSQNANVFFASNSNVLRSNDVYKLMGILDEYKKTRFRFQLVGHTDTVGATGYNLSLSKRRVEAVQDYLIKNGVKKSDIVLSYVGETAATKDDQMYNRRVEVNGVNAKPTFNTYEDFLHFLEPKEQIFEVNAGSNSLIEGDKGTVIRIPGGVFRYSNGLPVEGSISIRLKEFYTMADFISSGLSTISDGNLLKTGGMIHIKALKDTAELVLDESASIEIGFPRSSGERFYTFYGDTLVDGRTNWQLDELLWKKRQEDIAAYINEDGQLMVAEKSVAESKSRNVVYETATGKFRQLTPEQRNQLDAERQLQMERYNAEQLKVTNSFNQYYSVLQSRKMRWINCDLFINDPSNAIIDYLVTVANPDVHIMSVFLIYRKMNSTVQLERKEEGCRVYARLPMAQKPQLLITGMRKSQLMVFFENITPEKQGKQNVELKESSFEDLEKIMKGL